MQENSSVLLVLPSGREQATYTQPFNAVAKATNSGTNKLCGNPEHDSSWLSREGASVSSSVKGM